MDEPDLDELAWMACQQMPEEEDIYDDDDILFATQAPGDTSAPSTATESCCKRLLSEISEHLLVKESQGVGKRMRSEEFRPPVDLLGDPVDEDVVGSPSLPEAYWRNDHLPFRMASSINGDYLPVTSPSGDRVYAKFNPADYSLTRSRDRVCSSNVSKGTGLLLQPIEVMVEQAERERLRKNSDTELGDLSERLANNPGDAQEQLWVEKYAPKSFTDLLSDEHTNRQVLRWLKKWDACVFGHANLALTSKEVLVALRCKLPSAEGRGSKIYKQAHFGSVQRSKNGPFNDRSTSWTSADTTVPSTLDSQKAKESHEKVLLLCGPPGLGKTTLAHVAAKHCGYRIVEINASDDRVAATLQGKILDAVQMNSVTGDHRPNCLIIDEIDGAVGGTEGRNAIKHLIDIVKSSKKTGATPVEETESKDGSTKRVARKKKAAPIQNLVRPIICICNDLYAPALRDLRQVARVHVFTKPGASRIVTRLNHICKEEGIKTNIRVLTMLADQADNDIRACLNTLQFLKRNGQQLTSLEVGSRLIGSKDMTGNIYAIWQKIFQKAVTPSRLLVKQTHTECCSPGQEQLEFLRLYNLIADYGDHELILDGIHENLLHNGYQDCSLSKTVRSLHSIGDSDIWNNQVYSKQRYFLNGYQPLTPITIRALVAGPVRPHIQWPKAFQKYKLELGVRREMLVTWINRMSPAIARSMSTCCLTLDMLSPLLAILSPPLRPVAVQLYTKGEQETMKHLVETMVCYGLTYKHDKVENECDETISHWHGQGAISLDPPFHTMVNFEGYKAQHRQLSATLCQMLGHEIELERIRRESVPWAKPDQAVASSKNLKHPSNSSTNMSHGVSSDQDSNVEQARKPSVTTEQAAFTQKASCNILLGKEKEDESNLSAKPSRVQPVSHQPRSVFDGWKMKIIGSANDKKGTTLALNQRDSRPLLYKFHEGFTNAIRRPMLVREFL